MGRDSSIEWTDHTFSPWWGCVRISPACGDATGGGCYAEALDNRVGGAHWGPDAPRRFFSEKRWEEPLKWDRAAGREGIRKRVFCASMADVFEARADLDPWRLRLWAVIQSTTWLDWLLLTKRPENILEMVPELWRRAWPRNVWAGATAENQPRLRHVWKHLERVPAPVRFLSCEPLLEDLDLSVCMPRPFAFAEDVRCKRCGCGWEPDHVCPLGFGPAASWVIIGGETGHRPREMKAEWVRSMLQQCRTAGVPAFVKQGGQRFSDGGALLKLRKKGGELDDLPADLRVRQWPEAWGA